jgi:hypothetical protein
MCIFRTISISLGIHRYTPYQMYTVFTGSPVGKRSSVQKNVGVGILPLSSASYLDWKTGLQFKTIIYQIYDTPVSHLSEVIWRLAIVDIDLQESILFKVAPYEPDDHAQKAHFPHITLNQLNFAHHVLHDWTLEDSGMMVTAMKAQHMAYGAAYTHHICLQGPDHEKFSCHQNIMQYLRANIDHGLLYCHPTYIGRSDLPPGNIIDACHPTDFSSLEPVCYIDASYTIILAFCESRSVTGIIICIGGTSTFTKTCIQCTIIISSMESETMVECDAPKSIQYFCKLVTDLSFELTQPTPIGEDNPCI